MCDKNTHGNKVSAHIGFSQVCVSAHGYSIAVTSSPRSWIAVFVLPEKINVFQHGGDRERSRTQGPKNVHNCLLTVRKMS